MDIQRMRIKSVLSQRNLYLFPTQAAARDVFSDTAFDYMHGYVSPSYFYLLVRELLFINARAKQPFLKNKHLVREMYMALRLSVSGTPAAERMKIRNQLIHYAF